MLHRQPPFPPMRYLACSMRLPHTRKILVAALLLVLAAPLVQQGLGMIREKPLEGMSPTQAPAPSWSLESWLSGRLQDSLDRHLQQHAGFHHSFVRLCNQYYYSLFQTASANHVTIGEDHFLYDPAQIDAYLGRDFIGTAETRHYLLQFRSMHDMLLKKGIRSAFVLVPSKATAVPQHLPQGTPSPAGTTNYSEHRRLADSLGLPLLDLVQWYKERSAVSPYHMYASGGLHWTEYCATLAADTLLGYLSLLTGTDLPRIRVDRVEWSDLPRGADDDILRGMNLLFPPTSERLAYPTLHFEGPPPRLRVLTVGDSYYFKAFTDFSGDAFETSQFWFYFRELHVHGQEQVFDRASIDLRTQVNQQDLILFYISDGNLRFKGWGFPEAVQAAFSDPQWRAREIARLSTDMRKDAAWMEKIAAKAATEGISVDSMLHRDAIWVLENTRQ